MEARSLRYFQAVAEFGSLSRASEFLRISQPAVSRQVRRLEEELGRPLFKRNGHGVTLTDPGRILLERSQLILHQLEQTRIEIRSASNQLSGVVTLAVPPAAGRFLVPALIKRFGAEYPKVFVKIIAGFSGYIQEWLVRGSADIACLHDPIPTRGLTIVPLVSEEVFLVGRPGFFSFRRGFARPNDLCRVPLILPSRPNASRRLLDSWVSQRGLTLDIRLEVNDTSIIRTLLKEGVGLSLLSQGAFLTEVAHNELEALPFRPRVHWPLALVMPSNHPRADVVETLASMIRKTVLELTRSGEWPGRHLDL
jgi:LysR family transcriptional regulator, nitrogen assimilation regulatory protein